ncbi:putative sensory transduction histidine kinase [Tripterygium wilfordii]|uniref:Putative sensory transduction histidine kinase n=1 Tax=Tripterygium wilfordii TaxID=458696 RepID=A0A7J7DYN3_TRIWF|nr:two-component response regulator-like APRR3 [Tripterygium wilfordii]KAF5751502.1 putative sensory transduction histidine kinase [Tripterygium wilfordii]
MLLSKVAVGGQDNHMCYEQKKASNGVMGERQGYGPYGSSNEDVTRADGAVADVVNGPGAAIQLHDGLQIQQQPQGSATIIHWERFLPTRSLKVLLVENDDSTRHVVSALLRNCSYEVTAVANGFQAWKILEDRNNHIDLILTEVVMPILSGIGLLCKIMSHGTLTNIPVIMMSSHDSMGIVFKCLSKGAVDFLVKPIRKNELKNLWQHVWRRCHSSSGSGSESGTQTKKSVKSKSNDDYENDTSSGDEQDNGSNGPSIRDGSDDGRCTQSSWTKRAAESEGLQSLSPSCPLVDGPDSTCAQVIHLKPETYGNKWVHVTETKECPEQDERLENAAMGKDLEIGVSKPDSRLEYQCETSSRPSSKWQNKSSEVDSKLPNNTQLEVNNENISSMRTDEGPKLINSLTNYFNPPAESKDVDASNDPFGISLVRDKACCVSGEFPSLELTLKRLKGTGDSGNTTTDDRNVLRHSDLSAFSKYNTASSANQAPTANVGSCSPLNNSSIATKTEKMQQSPPDLNGAPLNQQSDGSSNNNEIASTAEYVTPKPEAFNVQSDSTSAFKSFQSSAFQSAQNDRASATLQVTPVKSDELVVNTVQAHHRSSCQQVQVQHHHHHHHHHHDHYYHVNTKQKHQSQPDHDDTSLRNMASTAPLCGSSNMLGGLLEGNAGNYSVNGSASGSNHGSDGQNGSSTAMNAGATNMESDNGAAGDSGTAAISGRVSENGTDDDRIALREAALNKFRQKRKERCFEKRVRYQSRKKLAEQRPRVRGQFVRQIMSDNKASKDCPGNDLSYKDNSSESAR